MVVRNGHTSINGVPVAVDDKGFVTGRDGSLLPIKYQDFYRQASVERMNKMVAEMAKMMDVSSEKELQLRPPRRPAWVPGPEIGLLPQFKLSREKRRLPKEMKHLVNCLSSKMNNLESTVEASMQVVTPKSSEPPGRSMTSTCCNCIHSLRHRRHTGSLLENEQAIGRDDDFVLRAMHDVHSVVRDMEHVSHQLSKSYSTMRKTICEAEGSNWALAKTVEASCTGALSLEKEEAHVVSQYYNLVKTLAWLQKKRNENEAKYQEMESTNQRLIGRVQELEGQVQEMSTNERLVERLQELADKVGETCTVESGQVNPTACQSSPKNTREIAESSSLGDSINDGEEGIVGRYEKDPAASWFNAFLAHNQNWKGLHDLSDSQKKNIKVLHELKVECGTINDQNKRLTSRLSIAEINSAKHQDRLRDLSKEKQNLQQRLQTSQKLLQYAQKSLVSQPDDVKARREDVNGRIASYRVSQSKNDKYGGVF
ncbi:paramyosin-like [Strongylocentrotus purpuratus]|uniref:Uncharacterized protein n=1 Tax=Strongylocentrotus purpuratus TaxID=7668 RepID=A0A7M7PQW8_STRPU|nr:paramyosin-like [Strongylocentrotus purpuratus]